MTTFLLDYLGDGGVRFVVKERVSLCGDKSVQIQRSSPLKRWFQKVLLNSRRDGFGTARRHSY